MRQKVPSGIDWSEGVPLSRYVVYDRIASGGTASVHLGRLAGVGGFARIVAIKKLHEHVATDPKFVAMLLDEARLLSSVRHPNVVTTQDIVEDGTIIALVMDYVAGVPLFDAMKALAERGEPIPTPIALALAVHTLQGLDAAHEAVDGAGKKLEIVHRDVSPQNILVGTDGLARIIDFGIAQGAERLQTTQAGEVKGKVAYMAPEQLNGERIDRRSDIFAVGVVLWEMLTSKRLFFEKTEGHTVTNVLHKKVEPPIHAGFATTALNSVVLRSLDRDPNVRFQTCADMADALEESMAIAKPREVAAWIERVDPARLAERRAMVRRIESLAIEAPQPSSQRISRLLAAVSETERFPPRSPPKPVAPAKPAPPPARTEPPTVRPQIRKVRTSSDSAITNIRIGSKGEIDEIRRLYEAGNVAAALVRAETVRVEERLAPSSIPRVNLSLTELLKLPLDHRAGFMLTRVDGATDVESILNVAGMPHGEAIEVLDKLLTVGAVSIVGDRGVDPSDDVTLPPNRKR